MHRIVLAIPPAGRPAATRQAPHAGHVHACVCGCIDDRATIVVSRGIRTPPPGRIRIRTLGDRPLSDPAALRGLSARTDGMTAVATGAPDAPTAGPALRLSPPRAAP